MIVQASASTGTADISFTVPGTAAAKVQEVLQEKQDELGYQSFDVDANVGKVAVVGVGMKTHSGLAAKFFNALSDEGVNVLMIHFRDPHRRTRAARAAQRRRQGIAYRVRLGFRSGGSRGVRRHRPLNRVAVLASLVSL